MSGRLDENSVKAAFGKIAEAVNGSAKSADSGEADRAILKSSLALACDLVLTLHDIRDALGVLASSVTEPGSGAPAVRMHESG